MNIEEFFLKSVGEWKSMRSGHSLAFQEFEEIRSKIRIFPSKRNDYRVLKFVKDNLITISKENKVFIINWEAESEWSEVNQEEKSSGESILIPIELSKKEGKIIRSVGYTEAIQVVSLYKILEDETLIIYSDYNHLRTEERIRFVSNNLRSRSTVTRSIDSSAILQTSYASEIRSIKK